MAIAASLSRGAFRNCSGPEVRFWDMMRVFWIGMEVWNVGKNLLGRGGLESVHAPSESAVEARCESRSRCRTHRSLNSSLRCVAEDARGARASDRDIKQSGCFEHKARIGLPPGSREYMFLQSRNEHDPRGKSFRPVHAHDSHARR